MRGCVKSPTSGTASRTGVYDVRSESTMAPSSMRHDPVDRLTLSPRPFNRGQDQLLPKKSIASARARSKCSFWSATVHRRESRTTSLRPQSMHKIAPRSRSRCTVHKHSSATRDRQLDGLGPETDQQAALPTLSGPLRDQLVGTGSVEGEGARLLRLPVSRDESIGR
jgi:hypothetical protein